MACAIRVVPCNGTKVPMNNTFVACPCRGTGGGILQLNTSSARGSARIRSRGTLNNPLTCSALASVSTNTASAARSARDSLRSNKRATRLAALPIFRSWYNASQIETSQTHTQSGRHRAGTQETTQSRKKLGRGREEVQQ